MRFRSLHNGEAQIILLGNPLRAYAVSSNGERRYVMAQERLDSKEIFGILTPDQVHALSDVAERIECNAGQTLYERGAPATHFFVVVKGDVALRLPSKQGVSLLIDDLGPGSMFGSCVSFAMDTYSLTAQCTEDCELLKVATPALRNLLDGDPRMGYAIQSRISEIYFTRYIDTMKKLQAIVMNIPLDVAGGV
jgi:CRP-like cAMP-binding protein